jgi:NADH dehydrogenase
MQSGSRNIVVLGAGYGGITAALQLAKFFKSSSDYQVHLVDRNPYHTLKTQLHEAAVHKREVTIDIGRIIQRRNVTFHLGEVSSFDLVKSLIMLESRSLAFKYLILAMGSQANFYDIPGLEQRAFSLQTVFDAERIYRHISSVCAQASSEENEVLRKIMLRFVVGGGGLAGIEFAGELADHVSGCVRDYHVSPEEVEIILVEAGDSILPSLNSSTREQIQQKLTDKGVKVLTKTAITGLSAESVTLSVGGELGTRTLVWTGGIRIGDLVRESGMQTGQSGRIVVNAFLQSVDHPNVYAIGDNANAINPKTGKSVPAAAQFALQQGRLVAHNIWSSASGREQKEYEPKVWGEIVGLGRHLAVGWLALPLLKKVTFVGFLANLLKTAVEQKHIILLRKESRNWISSW